MNLVVNGGLPIHRGGVSPPSRSDPCDPTPLSKYVIMLHILMS